MRDSLIANIADTRPGKLPARAIVLAAIAALLVLQQVLQLPGNGSLQLALQNAAHTPLFLLLTVLLWHVASPFLNGGLGWKLLQLAVVVMVVAALTEIAQKYTGRDASVEDWARDMLGAAAAITLVMLRELRPLHTGKRLALGIACALLLCAGFASVFQVLERRQLQAAMVPDLLPLNAEVLRGMSRIRGVWRILEQPGSATTGRALELQFDNSPFPGLMLREPVSDWRGYNWLELDVQFAGNARYVLTVRVETFTDRGMDRTVQLPSVSGRTRYRIPLAQLVDGSSSERDKIKNLLIFTDHKGHGQTLLIHGIRLK